MGIKHFYSYTWIGLASALIDVGVFAILFELMGIGIFLSNAVSVGLAAIFSFCLNTFYNFKKTNHLIIRFISFLLVVVFGYFAGIFIILLSINFLELNGLISKVVSLPIVFLLQFFLNSKISFH